MTGELHEHAWVEITTHSSKNRMFLCVDCGEIKEEPYNDVPR